MLYCDEFLIPQLTEQLYPRIVVRVGDEVTLPCDNVRDYQDKCQRTSWLFVGSGNTTSKLLIDRGQIGENSNSKSDRLSVTANYSLVIKVTAEDVGQYTCRQFNDTGHQQGPDSHVDLSVITSEYLHHNKQRHLQCIQHKTTLGVLNVMYCICTNAVDRINKPCLHQQLYL
uniref:Ig-like domain-containing protein n=1 Tax=Dicentrarchus labrax TaxID=13489 RepID=A0A8P4K8K7_DICLA